jgi:hypothetical protein
VGLKALGLAASCREPGVIRESEDAPGFKQRLETKEKKYCLVPVRLLACNKTIAR